MELFNDCVDVVYSRVDLADTYNRHMAASMMSVMKHCSKKVNFHVLHDECISFKDRENCEINMQLLRNMVSPYGCDVYYHHVELPDWIDSIDTKRWNRAVFYKFYLPDVISDSSCVVVLGTDVIVKTDLSQLILSMPSKYSYAGVSRKYINYNDFSPRSYIPKERLRLKSLGCDFESTVIGCVMIFNMKKIREGHSLPNKALACLKEHPDLEIVDEDVFNIIFFNDIYYLPPQYNIFLPSKTMVRSVLRKGIENIDDCILHYAGPTKPWDKYSSKLDLEYWKYLSLTPYGGDYFDSMFQIIQPPGDFIENIDDFIWRIPLSEKLKLLWKLTLPLYWKLFKKYFHHGISILKR